MPKKELKTTEKPEVKKASTKDILMGTGRRKTSIARVWLKMGKGDMIVNEKPIDQYFPSLSNRKIYEEPFKVVNRIGGYSGSIKVVGGGISSQLGAISHGIARALAASDPAFREVLSKKKLLTRDSRMKERRKYGHAGKARKMKQSPKR